MAILTSLLTLNPEVEKFSFFNKYENQTESIFIEDIDVDLKSSFQFVKPLSEEKSFLLKNHILYFIISLENNIRISTDVLSQCYSLIDILYPSILEKLEFDNVYSTTYGTVVFDWEKDSDNVFSLEIGAKELGYFIEVNGTDIKQVDAINLEISKMDLLNDLSSFLSN